jgi:hypothetical protein
MPILDYLVQNGSSTGQFYGMPDSIVSFDRDQHSALPWICRPAGANAGSNGDDGDHTIVVIFPSLYRCTDSLEWDQSITRVGYPAFCLTKRLIPWSEKFRGL